MAHPEAQTAFLAEKDKMLQAILFDPEDSRNTGASKSGSHIGNCSRLNMLSQSDELSTSDRQLKMGELASKAFKVASGYSMRAGYLHPDQPETLYRERIVHLIDESGASVPVLGESVANLATMSNRTEWNFYTMTEALNDGAAAAKVADLGLKDLLIEALRDDYYFTGSIEVQAVAATITLPVRTVFVCIGLGALEMQGLEPENHGPVILEPKSERQADHYLRIDELVGSQHNGITTVTSPHMIRRV
jgi:hypothetical protein